MKITHQTVKNIGYIGLVKLLTVKISPESRKIILDRLTDINNELLYGAINLNMKQCEYENSFDDQNIFDIPNNMSYNYDHMQFDNGMNNTSSYYDNDLSRVPITNTRKVNPTENIHPSMDILNYKGPNPIPLNNPVNSKMNPKINSKMNPKMNLYTHPAPCNNMQNNQSIYKLDRGNIVSGIDLDNKTNRIDKKTRNNFLDNKYEQRDSNDTLDEKLNRIKMLQNKISNRKNIK